MSWSNMVYRLRPGGKLEWTLDRKFPKIKITTGTTIGGHHFGSEEQPVAIFDSPKTGNLTVLRLGGKALAWWRGGKRPQYIEIRMVFEDPDGFEWEVI